MIILLFSLCSFPFLFAQDFAFDKEKGRAVPNYIGQIKLVKGKVFKQNEEGTAEVSPGERFRKSDVLVTSEKSFAKILVVDDTLISVGPKSELKFEDFDFTDKTDRKATFALLKGQLTGNVRNKAKPGDIKFKTRFTTMGVRGTYILMNNQLLGTKEIAEYALLSGAAEILDGENKNHPMKKGDHLILVHDSALKVSGEDKGHLPEALFESLSALKTDEEKEFKPFLPYFTPDQLDQNSSLYPLFVEKKAQADSSSPSHKRGNEAKGNWRENLQKLNEKLKQNRR